MATPSWLTDLGLENPSIDEFTARPDLRQIATFFSGILFAASVYYFMHSPTLASIISRIRRKRARRSTISLEAPRGDGRSKASTSMSSRLDPLSLVFILNLVYTTTSATQAGSLLAFSSAAGAVPCTFLMAWGALGSQTVRLIGLLQLSVHLRERGAAQWEKLLIWVLLVLLTVVMFLTTAVNTGVLRPIPQLGSFSLCYMRHFLLGAAVTRGMNLAIELYVLIRFITLLFPWIPSLDSKMQVVKDIHIHRALSLIILDGATIYPSLFPTSLLADFVPFSAASILVLMAFNYNTLPKQSLVSSILNVNPPSLPQSIRIPTPNFSPFLNLESSAASSKEFSVMDFTLDRRSGRSILVFNQEKEFPHPFAASSLTSAQHPARHWRSPNRAAGSLVGGSASLTDSMRDAVVTTANRTRLTPADDPVLLITGAIARPLHGNESPTSQRYRVSSNGSPRRSFLPALRTPREPSDSHAHTRSPSKETSMGRYILPRQAEVADRMIAGPRPSHRVVRQGSIVSLDRTVPSTPPAPPRTQRVIRQDPHPMKILSEEDNNPGDTRPSTGDSAVVFGSDILIRSQEDIMRYRREMVEGSGETGEASVGHGSGRTDSGEFRDGYRNSALGLQILNPSNQSIGASVNDGQYSDRTRPFSGQSLGRLDADTLSIVHEGLPSPIEPGDSPSSRRAKNAHKRPTFGEAFLDRFQRGFTLSDPPRPASQTSVPSTSTHRGARDSQPRSSRLVSRSRLRSSTVSSGQGTRQQEEGSQKRPST